MVARLENWAEGPQIPLSSSPFASEIPLPLRPASVALPSNDAPPPTLSDNPEANAVALAKTSHSRPTRAFNVLWVLLAIVVAGLVGYIAHR